jgi:hypothetical protein
MTTSRTIFAAVLMGAAAFFAPALRANTFEFGGDPQAVFTCDSMESYLLTYDMTSDGPFGSRLTEVYGELFFADDRVTKLDFETDDGSADTASAPSQQPPAPALPDLKKVHPNAMLLAGIALMGVGLVGRRTMTQAGC